MKKLIITQIRNHSSKSPWERLRKNKYQPSSPDEGICFKGTRYTLEKDGHIYGDASDRFTEVPKIRVGPPYSEADENAINYFKNKSTLFKNTAEPDNGSALENKIHENSIKLPAKK